MARHIVARPDQVGTQGESKSRTGVMLARLSIRDIVLIDRLDIDFTSSLSVLTGETGAGKSILLDAFALALGARGDVALVRQGAEQGQGTAAFATPSCHPECGLRGPNASAPCKNHAVSR